MQNTVKFNIDIDIKFFLLVQNMLKSEATKFNLVNAFFHILGIGSRNKNSKQRVRFFRNCYLNYYQFSLEA